MTEKIKEHKHYWELSHTQTQMTGMGTESIEHAYLVCKECGTVKKVEINYAERNL